MTSGWASSGFSLRPEDDDGGAWPAMQTKPSSVSRPPNAAAPPFVPSAPSGGIPAAYYHTPVRGPAILPVNDFGPGRPYQHESGAYFTRPTYPPARGPGPPYGYPYGAPVMAPQHVRPPFPGSQAPLVENLKPAPPLSGQPFLNPDPSAAPLAGPRYPHMAPPGKPYGDSMGQHFSAPQPGPEGMLKDSFAAVSIEEKKRFVAPQQSDVKATATLSTKDANSSLLGIEKVVTRVVDREDPAESSPTDSAHNSPQLPRTGKLTVTEARAIAGESSLSLDSGQPFEATRFHGAAAIPLVAPAQTVYARVPKCLICKKRCGRSVASESIPVPTWLFSLMFGGGPALEQIRTIAARFQVDIEPPDVRPDGDTAHVTVRGHSDEAAAAALELRELRDSMSKDSLLPALKSKSAVTGPLTGPNLVHIYIDYSNICIGARALGFAIGIGNLIRLLEDGRENRCANREMIGSEIDGRTATRAGTMGYNVRSYPRLHRKESLVDDKMHAQILLAIADRDRYPAPQTLILVTGDGNDNSGHGNTSFPKCAQLALSSSWQVEVWSWKQSLSAVYSEMARRNPQMGVRLLDTHIIELHDSALL
eukprot:m.229165 g.229165  ORF g.229165 m.229165 type:complete len:591 (-) comp11866_c0_seq1:339-2111(-)